VVVVMTVVVALDIGAAVFAFSAAL